MSTKPRAAEEMELTVAAQEPPVGSISEGRIVSVNRRFDALAQAHPERPVVIFSSGAGQETVLTWHEFRRRSISLAHVLAARGVGPGSYVAIALPNCPEHFVASAAAWRLGACALVVRSTLPARERDEILALARPAVVVSDWEDVAGLSRQDVAKVPVDERPLRDVVPAPAKAVCSGGSTGRPKIIVNPAPFVVSDGETGLVSRLGMRTGQTTLVSGALYHSAPYNSSVAALALDHILVLMDRFDAARAVDLIERHRVQFFYMAPTMMQRVVCLPAIQSRNFSSVQAMYHTSAPCPEWLKREWLTLMGPARVVEVFGATEAVGATVIDGVDWLRRPGSVGRAVGCDLRILDEDACELPPGEVGEIFMRPHASEPTYVYIGSDPARATDDGFVSVGDMGWVDDQGYLFPADRRLDLIISGGANVYPAQVEAALTEHPCIQDAAVIGVPDDQWGKRVHAVVQLRVAEDDLTHAVGVADLDAHVRERLASYKAPKSYEFVSQFPRDEAGKLRRSALVAERHASWTAGMMPVGTRTS